MKEDWTDLRNNENSPCCNMHKRTCSVYLVLAGISFLLLLPLMMKRRGRNRKRKRKLRLDTVTSLSRTLITDEEGTFK
jgi:hypothetical protein